MPETAWEVFVRRDLAGLQPFANMANRLRVKQSKLA
jgi:hypothetical protein